jgi:hypothetical protein
LSNRAITRSFRRVLPTKAKPNDWRWTATPASQKN